MRVGQPIVCASLSWELSPHQWYYYEEEDTASNSCYMIYVLAHPVHSITLVRKGSDRYKTGLTDIRKIPPRVKDSIMGVLTVPLMGRQLPKATTRLDVRKGSDKIKS